MKSFLKEVKDNPGLLPKILVIIFRFGNLVYFKIKVPVIRQLMILVYRLIDLLVVKLLLNDDISGKTKIGWGFKIYHPYGIFINSDAEIGENFICRGQVTIGNIGAKIIGSIVIGNGCIIGTNAVVVKSFEDNGVLVGVPAKNIRKK